MLFSCKRSSNKTSAARCLKLPFFFISPLLHLRHQASARFEVNLPVPRDGDFRFILFVRKSFMILS
jgi:hypothetical protein